jgi:hypothetical protein
MTVFAEPARPISTRWDVAQHLTTNEAREAASRGDGLIHAATSAADDYALCETDGPHLGGVPNYVRLNLDTPGANELRHTVTCPGCLEWMHA